jgi:hypothetical protein
MRHRMGIAAATHMGGNNSPVLLNNTGTLTPIMKKMMEQSFGMYKALKYGCDYQITLGQVIWGREPGYQYEPLTIISLSRIKGLSYLQTGKSFGAWGSGIRSRWKFYWEYKTNSKFKRFVDYWHSRIYPEFRTAEDAKLWVALQKPQTTAEAKGLFRAYWN